MLHVGSCPLGGAGSMTLSDRTDLTVLILWYGPTPLHSVPDLQTPVWNVVNSSPHIVITCTWFFVAVFV